jgi:iron complex outermembrane recepter protein
MNLYTGDLVAQSSIKQAVRLIIAGCAAVIAAPGLAAQAERDASSASLDEVVVTAQYTAQDLSKTPISISAITSEDLERNNIQQLNEILNDVPGVKLTRGPQGSFFNIRGINSMQGGGEIDPGMAFNVDGIYNPFSSAALMSFFDVSRIEVLRGPQGTLYGRNAIAGVVNVITRDPVFNEFGGNARIAVGNYSERAMLAAVNLPLGERTAARLVGNYQTHDGYMSNDHDNLNTMSGRGKVFTQATDSLKLGLTFDFGRFWGAGIGTARVYPFAADPWTTLPDLVPPFQRVRAFGYAGTAEWDAGPVTITYIPAYKSNDWDNQATNGALITRTSIYDTQTTHELRVASNNTESRLGWQAGAFLFDAENRQSLDFTAFRILQQVVTKSTAAFAQANYAITDRTRTTAGLRFTNDRKTEDGQNFTGTILRGSVQDSNSSWDSWTYRVGLERDVLAASMVYASVSTGFKAGGVSLSEGPAASFDPEELTAYQVGMKAKLLDNRLSINSELFYYDYSNYQSAYSSLNPLFGGQIRIISNAGGAKIKGGELESSFKFTPDDLLTASVAYIYGRFGSFVTPNGIGGINDYSRSEINSPTWTLSGSYRRYFQLGSMGQISPSLTANYRGGAYTDNRFYGPTHSVVALRGTRTSPFSYQGGYTKLDAAVSWNNTSEQYQVTAYANNLTNKVSATGINRNAQGLKTGYIESPRTYGLSFDVKFD